ncbi:MAG: AraC family transcriptional regulator, partial [Bermanella sp.]
FTRLATAAVLGIFYLQLCWQELHSEVNLKKQDVLKTAKHLKRNYLVMSLGIVIIFLFILMRLPREFTWLLSVLLMAMAFATSWLFIKLPEMGHNRRTPDTQAVDNSGEVEETAADQGINSEKNYRSSVTQKMANQSMQALTQLLDEGIYKDSTLSLGKLASEMKVSNHHLSQIINQQYQGSYYDLIHKYRISEAKRLLRETAFSIADITYEVGYNSKSVFYTEFKRQTELTPSQYKKSSAPAMQ